MEEDEADGWPGRRGARRRRRYAASLVPMEHMEETEPLHSDIERTEESRRGEWEENGMEEEVRRRREGGGGRSPHAASSSSFSGRSGGDGLWAELLGKDEEDH